MKYDFKPIGVVRHIDDLGRVVIPKEFRDGAGISPGARVSIYCDAKGNMLIVPFKENAK